MEPSRQPPTAPCRPQDGLSTFMCPRPLQHTGQGFIMPFLITHAYFFSSPAFRSPWPAALMYRLPVEPRRAGRGGAWRGIHCGIWGPGLPLGNGGAGRSGAGQRGVEPPAREAISCNAAATGEAKVHEARKERKTGRTLGLVVWSVGAEFLFVFLLVFL